MKRSGYASLAAGLAAVFPQPVATTLDLAGEDLPPALEARLKALEPVLVAVYETRPAILAVFALVAGAILLAAVYAAFTGRIRNPAPWRYALLVVMSFPAASVLMFALYPEPSTGRAVVLALIAALALTSAAAILAARFVGPRRALVGLLLGTTALLLVDQWLGGPWSFTGVLGYSPLDGVRFYGMGNEAAAILFATAVLGAGLAVDAFPRESPRTALAWLTVGLLGAVTVLTSAAPGLGANITVALWGTAGFVVTALLASGARLRPRHAIVVAVVVLAIVVAFAAYDLARPDGGTHLARTLRSVLRDGPEALVPLLTGKLAMNLRILTATPGSLVVLVAMGWLAYALVRPKERLRAALSGRAGYKSALWGAIAGSGLALVTEDSGIVIPALVLLFLAGSLPYVMTLRPVHLVAEERPAPHAPAEEATE